MAIMEQINEQWRPIEGYEGLYEVSNLGRVRSLDRGREKILKPYINNNGYLLVGLCKEGKHKTLRVHRLVAHAFIPNPEGLPQINHKDEDKTNNVVFLKDDGSVDKYRSNLEWCDCKYNINYGSHNERRVQTRISNGTYDPEMCGLDKKEHDRLYSKKWYQSNREKIRERQRNWYQKNQEKMREYQREYQREYYLRRKKTS